MIKHVTDTTGGTNFGFCLVEAGSYITDGAVRVISQTVNQYHATTGTEAFIHGRRIVFTAAALGFVEGLVDNMGRDLIFLGPLNESAQGQVPTGIDTTGLGANIDFTTIFAVDLGLGGSGLGHGVFAILIGSSHSW